MSGAWSWPTEPDSREPFPDALRIADPARARLAAAIADAEAGLVPDDVLRQAAGPLEPEPLLAAVAGDLPSEEDLVRIATEHDPGVVGSAPDLVLGPWADLADRHTRLVAVAWGALFPGDGWDTSPAARWLRSKPGPPLDLRPGLVAILRTPPAAWRLTALHGDRIEVQDLLGLEAPFGPIRLRPPATPVGPPRVGGWLMARIVRTGRGAEAVTPIAVPSEPAVLARWLGWAAAYARAVHPQVRTVGDVLRAHGHHLARRLLETAWTPDR